MHIYQYITRMLIILIFGSISLTKAEAVVITEATSEVDYYHAYTVNNGVVPQGININNLPQSLVIQGNAQSNVEQATAINESESFVQVGNPFSEPPLPYEARREDRTAFNGGAEGAQANYDISVTARDDPNADPLLTSIVERTVDNSGAAEIVLSTEAAPAQASSSYSLQRGYLIENISNQTQSFSITGDVVFDMFSNFEGLDGFANASMSVFALFENVQAVDASFQLTSAYNPVITQSGPDTSIFESLTFNEPNVGGFLLTAISNAQGSGGLSTASISDMFSYQLDFIMGAGTAIEFITGFVQGNEVAFAQQPINVNVPSTLLILMMVALGLLAKQQRLTHDLRTPI